MVIQPGECHVVTGNNGSGKSSLLKIATGLIEAREGTVSRVRNCGMSSLEHSLYLHLSGRQHLEFVANCHGLLLSNSIDLAGLDAAMDQPVREYSSGMRARLKHILATLPEPDLLILDEPSVSLDEPGRAWVRALMQKHLERGGGMLVATNEPGDKELATHVLHLA